MKYPLGKDYQGVGQQGNQGAKQYKYRKPAKTEQSDSDESTESTDGSEIGFISTKCALRRPLTYDNHPSNPIPSLRHFLPTIAQKGTK